MTVARQPYVWCEPFAGSAAVTYWLLGGKPPISYMGGKSGYSSVIANILGLSQHHKPAGIILGEPGPFAAVHATLGGASGSAEDVAEILFCASRSFRGGEPATGYKDYELYAERGTRGEPKDIAALPTTVESLPMPAARQVAAIIRSWKDEEPRALWERLKAKGWPSLLLPEGCRGRWLGPQSVEEVAGYLSFLRRSHQGGGGFARQYSPATEYHKANGKAGWHNGVQCLKNYEDDYPAPAVESLPPFPPLAVWQGFAEDLTLPADLSGVVIFADPPYQGTTGYKHGSCNRETVLRLARDWSGRGATVAISEAVRLDRELGDGWHAVQIDHARKGQKRTFSKQQDEWVTLNRPPQYVPPKQQGLFG